MPSRAQLTHTIAHLATRTGRQVGAPKRSSGAVTNMARAAATTAQPRPICTTAMMGQRTGSRVGQRIRSSGAALMDTRGARGTPPWSAVLVMEPARMEGPPLSVLLCSATNRASCRLRWPHREATTMQCPGEGQETRSFQSGAAHDDLAVAQTVIAWIRPAASRYVF